MIKENLLLMNMGIFIPKKDKRKMENEKRNPIENPELWSYNVGGKVIEGVTLSPQARFMSIEQDWNNFTQSESFRKTKQHLFVSANMYNNLLASLPLTQEARDTLHNALVLTCFYHMREIVANEYLTNAIDEG